MKNNPYIPYPVLIDDIVIENDAQDLKTFKLVFEREEDEEEFRYLPGQFAEVSVFGYGESPFGIASSPTERGYVLFTVKRTGVVTRELHLSERGRRLGLRGPLGRSFPWERMKGKNVLVVGGGFAFTTLRSAVVYMSEEKNRGDFEKITVIYGARNPGELMYKETIAAWEESSDIDMYVTVDRGDEAWKGREGFVPQVLADVAPSAKNTIAIVCGPPVMIKFTIPVLENLGFAGDDIILSLEMRMKCGIGKCGRCNIGSKYVCVDGPVFTYRELGLLPGEF